MIILDVDSFCSNCPEFEPDINKKDYYIEDFISREYIVDTTITCSHRHRCKCVEQYIKRSNKREKKND